MKKNISKTKLATYLLMILSSSWLAAQTDQVIGGSSGQVIGSNVTGGQDAFHQAMQKALADQQTRVNTWGNQATNRSNAPMTIDKVALGNAMIMLDVKRTLVSNFWDNPVTLDPTFQQTLIRILNQDTILESDLALLQNMADQIRARMAQQSMQQAAAAQQTAAPQTTQVQPSNAIPTPVPTPASTTVPSTTTTSPTITHPIVVPAIPQPGVVPAQPAVTS
jgi:hypothetical protein